MKKVYFVTTLYTVATRSEHSITLCALCPHQNACSVLRICNSSSVSILEEFWNGKRAFEEFEQNKERALSEFCKSLNFDLSGKENSSRVNFISVKSVRDLREY